MNFNARDVVQCGHVHEYEPDKDVRLGEVIYPFGPSKALLLCGDCRKQFIELVLRDCQKRLQREET